MFLNFLVELIFAVCFSYDNVSQDVFADVTTEMKEYVHVKWKIASSIVQFVPSLFI